MSDSKTESKKKRDDGDGGYGWVCVFACFMVHTLQVGLERLFGMLYPDILDKFGQKAAAVAGVGGVCSALRLGLGPLSSFLSNRFSPRKVVMTGGVIMFIGMVASGFPPSVTFLYFSWSGLVGFGSALVYTPSLIVLSTYFRRRLPLANGLATAGSGVGSVIFPLLYAVLVEEYNFSFAVMIVAAIGLNTVNCGALYRPAKKYSVLFRREHVIYEENSDDKDDVIVIDDQVVKNDHEATPMTETNDEENQDNRNMIKSSGTKPRQRGLDFRLFINLRFDLFLLSVGLMTLSCVPVMTFLPAVMVDQGFSRADTAFTMSILGIPDTVARLSAGALYSLVPWFTKHRRQLFVFYQMGIIVMLALLANLSSFSAYIICAVIYGFFMGTTVAMAATLLADWVRHTDPDRDTASGLGFMTFSRGAGTIVGPIVGGFLRDVTGTYKYTFYFLSVMMFISTMVYLVLIVVDHFMSKKKILNYDKAVPISTL